MEDGGFVKVGRLPRTLRRLRKSHRPVQARCCHVSPIPSGQRGHRIVGKEIVGKELDRPLPL